MKNVQSVADSVMWYLCVELGGGERQISGHLKQK